MLQTDEATSRLFWEAVKNVPLDVLVTALQGAKVRSRSQTDTPTATYLLVLLDRFQEGGAVYANVICADTGVYTTMLPVDSLVLCTDDLGTVQRVCEVYSELLDDPLLVLTPLGHMLWSIRGRELIAHGQPLSTCAYYLAGYTNPGV